MGRAIDENIYAAAWGTPQVFLLWSVLARRVWGSLTLLPAVVSLAAGTAQFSFVRVRSRFFSVPCDAFGALAPSSVSTGEGELFARQIIIMKCRDVAILLSSSSVFDLIITAGASQQSIKQVKIFSR